MTEKFNGKIALDIRDATPNVPAPK